ncbi:ATP-binding cassette domain-containing protein [Clavibacter phaseoli]|uniref:ATP-binding cassette domain-containing protein n=2 Tax=Clavibacter phaseoli TaxID=1734031 RepID=UPI001EEF47AA|nr:ATP-binding cassette domain-containing protein [Clavibacter phaseoli]UKF29762.1 ATP-binding cassette domain-containing protein [Clavibacter phaseoli]UKF35680.1 ATP-binding cassette domain-containing protein [Clavibacter phaseoli]
MAVIEADGLVKTYHPRGAPPVHALAGLGLEVPEGTVLGLLGPNGAGKTTAVKVLTTLVRPDAGSARVDGVDVLTRGAEVRAMIGVSGQYAAVDENLTAFENLDMIGRLYHLGRRASRARADELIGTFGLTDARDRAVKGFSGGMRRRIDLAGALVARPRVLFLDEPTTGLDPRSRLGLWDVITQLVTEGTTVLLTTQYLEEADRLADDIAVIDGGTVIARGTADELKSSIGGHRVEVALVRETDGPVVRGILERAGTTPATASSDGRTLSVQVADGPRALAAVLGEMSAAGIELHDAGMRRPTLDDVFLRLTGHATAGEGDDSDTPGGSDPAPGRRAAGRAHGTDAA